MNSTKEDRTMPTMQPPRPPRRPKRSGVDLRKLVSTRRGSVIVAVAAAVLAASVLLVFLSQYRRSLNLSDKSVTVLVARSLIEKGSSGTLLAEKSIFQTARVRKRDLKNGAIADPSNLRGKVAVDDIYPGQQLVVGDFAPATGGVRERIAGDERAISLPLDNSHGMIGDVQGGDHVDVLFASGSSGIVTVSQTRATVTTLLRDLLVLRAPKSAKAGGVGGPTSTQEVVLRATDTQAVTLAYAADNGKVWLVLRPKVGATDSKPVVVDQRAVLISAIAAALRERKSR
jgi:Flp pilus assembly protein CpaB